MADLYGFVRATHKDLEGSYAISHPTCERTDDGGDGDVDGKIVQDFYQSVLALESEPQPQQRKRQRRTSMGNARPIACDVLDIGASKDGLSPPSSSSSSGVLAPAQRCTAKAKAGDSPSRHRHEYYHVLTPPSSPEREPPSKRSYFSGSTIQDRRLALASEARRGESPPRSILKPPREKPRSFYCDGCKETFTSQTREEHEASISHRFHTQAAPELIIPYALDASNPGRRLLEQQGWSANTGLGKDGNGILAPIATRFKSDRRGIGSASVTTKRRTHTADDIAEAKAKEREMQEREHKKAPTGRYLTPKERAEEERRQRKKEAVVHELLYTDNWEYLRPGQAIQF
mmetsp:Transcript_41174/g.73825  ORF Transcript_41174/g.73825 Transcript_41174/m.73825 type:complete len:345 (-) Transcript_41174:41-1075(-)